MIIDTCIGFNEIDLFRVRYNELADIVDQFLIVEATHTHSGNPKPLFFADWKSRLGDDDIDADVDFSRITVLSWDNSGMPNDNAHAWYRENMQREIIGMWLRDNCASTDIAMLSDMDEIPKADSLESFLQDVSWVEETNPFVGVWRFEQDLSYLYFNTTAGKWCGTKIFKVSELCAMQSEKPMTDLIRYRPEHMIAGTIQDGGWHFSSCGGAEKVREKMLSYAHTEQQDLRTPEDIHDSLRRLVDPFNKNPLHVVSEDFLPNYVRQHRSHYDQYIYSGNHRV